MLHTVMQAFSLSRTTSYSISFQPRSDSSTSTCAESPPRPPKMWAIASSNSASVSAIRLPLPPSENPTRSITGRPIRSFAARASSGLSQASLRATLTPISASRALNRPRSSVSRMLPTGVPSTWTLVSLKKSSSARPQPRAVWPPKESATPSTFSAIAISRTKSGVTAFR